MSSGLTGIPRFSGPNFLDWRRESRSFDELVAMTPLSVNMTGLGEAERLQGTVTTTGLLAQAEMAGISERLVRADPDVGRGLIQI